MSECMDLNLQSSINLLDDLAFNILHYPDELILSNLYHVRQDTMN